MTRPGLIWGGAIHDCSECSLTLLDALAFASDADIFEVNYRAGASITSLMALKATCLNVRRSESGFASNLKLVSLPTLPLPS